MKSRSTLALLLFKGLETKHTTVKWTIGGEFRAVVNNLLNERANELMNERTKLTDEIKNKRTELQNKWTNEPIEPADERAPRTNWTENEHEWRTHERTKKLG